jgi:hypothetical protein
MAGIVRGVRVRCGSGSVPARRFGQLRFGQLRFSRFRCLRFDGRVSRRQPGRAFDRRRMLAEQESSAAPCPRQSSQTARDDQCRFERPSTSPRHRYRSPSRPRGSARRGSVSAEASHALKGSRSRSSRLRGSSRFGLEQQNGVVRRRHFDGTPDDLVPMRPSARACAIKERMRPVQFLAELSRSAAPQSTATPRARRNRPSPRFRAR